MYGRVPSMWAIISALPDTLAGSWIRCSESVIQRDALIWGASISGPRLNPLCLNVTHLSEYVRFLTLYHLKTCENCHQVIKISFKEVPWNWDNPSKNMLNMFRAIININIKSSSRLNTSSINLMPHNKFLTTWSVNLFYGYDLCEERMASYIIRVLVSAMIFMKPTCFIEWWHSIICQIFCFVIKILYL